MIFTPVARLCLSCDKTYFNLRLRGYLDTCPPCHRRRRVSEWKKANPGRKLALNRAWVEKNVEKNRQMKADWSKSNPAAGSATQAQRRAKKLCATPAWANHFFIKQAYELAQLRTKMFGFEWHVDHVIPLQGELVCGLHVETNLQVIPGRENTIKSNKFTCRGNP